MTNRVQPGEEGNVLAGLAVGLKTLFGDNASKALEYALRVISFTNSTSRRPLFARCSR